MPSLLVAYFSFPVVLLLESQALVYTNHWALRIAGGPRVAEHLAAQYGYTNLGQVRADPRRCGALIRHPRAC